MSLTVNGIKQAYAPITLQALLTDLGYKSENVATAVNGVFISKLNRDSLNLEKGDEIEILAPMQGG